MKTKIILGIATTLLFVGCGSLKPIIEPKAEQVHSFKDYLVQKRPTVRGSYSIIAEQDNKTLIATRDYNVMTATGMEPDNVLRVLDDTVGYCKLIGGVSIYGDASIRNLSSYRGISNVLNSNLNNYKTLMKTQGSGKYSGFYKCVSHKDGFEIEFVKSNIGYKSKRSMTGSRLQFSTYYMVEHDKKQESGFAKKWLQSNDALRKYNSNKTIKEIISNEDGRTYWSYLLVKNANTNCSYNGGELFIANILTNNTQMSFGDYLIARVEQIKDKKNSSLIFDRNNEEYMWCSNRDKSKEFSLKHKEGKLYFSQDDIKTFIDANNIKTNTPTIELADKSLRVTNGNNTNENIATAPTALSTEKILATMTIGYKNDTTKDTTLVSYATSYNGKSVDGCQLASVISTNKSSGKQIIHNYKQCEEGKVKDLGETQQADIDSKTIQNDYKAASADLIANCKVQGYAIASLNGPSTIATCIQGKNANSAMKIVVMKDDKLLKKIIR